MPVALKDPKQVSADSLQSPHDPDVTYTGHKGKGYEVQVAETCHEENATQLITHVEVTPSSGSDTDVSVPVVDGLAERKVRPEALRRHGVWVNAFEASRRGTELVTGSAPGNSHEGEGDGPSPPRTFRSTSQGSRPRCAPPATRPSRSKLKDAPERVEVHFAGTTCEPCPLRSRCPVKLDRRAGAYVLKADLVNEHRAAPEGRGHRGVAQAVSHKGWYRGNELRAEAPTGLGACGFGGGIGTSNTLTVLRSTISNNTSFREGGGIRNVWGSVEVIDSTISGNAAWRGGGISSENDDFGGTITVTNSTLSGNIATDSGGGIYWRTETFLFMTNSTITGNRAGSSGGGLYSASYPINLANTIIAGNTAPGSPDCFFDFFEGSNDGYNLIGDTRGCDFDSVESDLINVDPVLGPLQDNGGPTLTHALLSGSPAIDQIPSLDCEGTTDQRGVVRPQGSACDIGSYELEQAEFTVDSTDSTADVNLGDGVCEDGAGNCTLRAAVQEANALGGQNTINLPAGTYDLTYIITIKSDLAIVGAGAADTIVVGDGNSFTVFDILSGTVVISDLTAQDGDQGISNDGTVTLTNVTVDGGNPPNGQRGGINNRGTLTLIRT